MLRLFQLRGPARGRSSPSKDIAFGHRAHLRRTDWLPSCRQWVFRFADDMRLSSERVRESRLVTADRNLLLSTSDSADPAHSRLKDATPFSVPRSTRKSESSRELSSLQQSLGGGTIGSPREPLKLVSQQLSNRLHGRLEIGAEAHASALGGGGAEYVNNQKGAAPNISALNRCCPITNPHPSCSSRRIFRSGRKSGQRPK